MTPSKIPGLPDLSDLLSSKAQGYPLRVHGGVIGMHLQRVTPKPNQTPEDNRQPADKNANGKSNAETVKAEQGKKQK